MAWCTWLGGSDWSWKQPVWTFSWAAIWAQLTLFLLSIIQIMETVSDKRVVDTFYIACLFSLGLTCTEFVCSTGSVRTSERECQREREGEWVMLEGWLWYLISKSIKFAAWYTFIKVGKFLFWWKFVESFHVFGRIATVSSESLCVVKHDVA